MRTGNMFDRLCVIILTAAFMPVQHGLAQTAPIAPATDANGRAHASLAAAVRTDGVTAEGWKPWHMKAEFQLFRGAGSAGSGTLEEWWLGPNRWKRSFSTTDDTGTHSGTEWSLTKGQRFIKGDINDKYKFHRLDVGVAIPLTDPLFQIANYKPEMELAISEMSAGLELHCVSAVDPARYAGKIKPDFLFPKLCFDNTDHVRILETSDTSVFFNGLKPFRGRVIATAVDIKSHGEPASSLKVKLLEALADADTAQVQPDTDATPEPWIREGYDPAPEVISSGQLIYPISARAARVAGLVIVRIIVQKDGTTRLDGDPFGPPTLIGAAKDAALKTRFRPYQVGGEIVELAEAQAYSFSPGQTATVPGTSDPRFNPPHPQH